MNTKQPVTVFGATGKIGNQILLRLSKAEVPTLAITRDLQKAVALPFVEWLQADMNNKQSLLPTMLTGSTVFLVSPMSEHMVEGQTNVIRTAQANHVGHVVKLSSGAVDKTAHLPIAIAHGQIEATLQESGLPWTMLRPNGFMQNWLNELAQTVRQERKIYEATGDGKRTYIDLRDIAEVAAQILLSPQLHAGRAYFLTGSQAVNYAQIAGYISQAIGEEVSYVALTADQARQRLQQKGLPTWAIETFLAYAQEQRAGRADLISPAVADILHKPARRVDAFIQEHAAQFAG